MFKAERNPSFARHVSIKKEVSGDLIKVALQPVGFDDPNITVKIRWKGQACAVTIDIASAPLENRHFDTIVAAKNFVMAMNYAIELAEEVKKQFSEGVGFVPMTQELLSLDLPTRFDTPQDQDKPWQTLIVKVGNHFTAMGLIWSQLASAERHLKIQFPDLQSHVRTATLAEMTCWNFVIEQCPENVDRVLYPEEI